MIRISIVIPSLNSGEYLLRAVQSVLNSGIDNLECLVMDSGSQDGSLELLPTNDSQLRVYRNVGEGQGASINAGLAVATGEIIGILKSTDTYSPHALAKVFNHFVSNTNSDVLYGQVNLIDAYDQTIRRLNIYSPTREHLRDRECLRTCAFFIRRRLIDQYGKFDESLKFWAAYDYWMKLVMRDVSFSSSRSILGNERILSENDLIDFDRAQNSAYEAFRLVEDTLKVSSTRWALKYGRACANKAGHMRHHSTTFDYLTLKSAITKVMPTSETDFQRWSRISAILKQHFLSEFNKIRKQPRLALRFLSFSKKPGVKKNNGSRLFQLRYEEPRTCLLPAKYFTPVKIQEPPTISIVTPNMNQGKFIERTLRSVFDQNYPKLEYVVQDGCSTDDSLSIIRRYESRLASWESIRDNGQSQAINLGLARTSGDIMAYLNSDDTLTPGSLAYVAKYFQDHPTVDVVYGNRLLIDEQDRVINQWVLPDHDSETLRWADYIPQETLFWRRKAWDAVGSRIDESFQFAMDWDLILRFQSAGMVFKRLPRFLGAFRITDSQKSSQLINTFGLREMNRLRLRELGYIPTDKDVARRIRRYFRSQRRTEKFYELTESISQLISPYCEWKIEDSFPVTESISTRSAA